VPPFGLPFGTPNLKSHKKTQKTVSGRQARTNVVPEQLRNGKILILHSNYHMFSEVEHLQFRCLLVSFWLSFGVTFPHLWQKGGICELKSTGPKKHRQFMKKGSQKGDDKGHSFPPAAPPPPTPPRQSHPGPSPQAKLKLS